MPENPLHEQIIARLDEHGREIREMRSLIERMVRIEERQNGHAETFSRIFQSIEANSAEIGALRERVHRVEASSASSITSLGWLERTLWALIAAGAWMAQYFLRAN